MRVEIYTDGSCLENPGGAGGWAAILKCLDVPIDKLISGGEEETTNNRMELQAVVEAVNALKAPCRVTVYSDSQYVVKCGNREYSRRANTDLWNAYEEAAKRHEIRFEWVKGHDGHPENESAHDEAEKQARLAHRRRVRRLREERGERVDDESEALHGLIG